jgi:hypothetical protein
MKKFIKRFVLAVAVFVVGSSANADDVSPNKIQHVICYGGASYDASIKAIHEDLHRGSMGMLVIKQHPGFQFVSDKQSITLVPGTNEACIPVTLVKEMPAAT